MVIVFYGFYMLCVLLRGYTTAILWGLYCVYIVVMCIGARTEQRRAGDKYGN